jgi:chromate transporter
MPNWDTPETEMPLARGTAGEVFVAALGLGLTSFGGPIAHLGYFERAYVERRRWISADDYAGLVALSQMIPGPASSQVSLLIGLRRAGWTGAFAAWLGFTLPSTLLMFGFAALTPHFSGPFFKAGLHGLKLVAVAVVAQAVWSMWRKLCPDRTRSALALLAMAILLLAGSATMQLLVLLLGALGGMFLCRNIVGLPAPPKLPIGHRTGIIAGILFLALLVGLPLVTQLEPRSLLTMAAIFYKAGALVFGGGHVVLPLLRDSLVPIWVSDHVFLSGYGAAQAVPGPLFTFSAYLGAVIPPVGSAIGKSALFSVVALVFLFMPGVLVALAGLPLWNWMSGHGSARGALAGINAAVVGVLGAALYNPIWTTAILSAVDLAIALIAFVFLERWRVPPVSILIFCVATELLRAAFL